MAPSIRVGCSLLRDRMRPSVRPLLTRAWIVQGVGQRKAWSLEHVHRHASRRAVAAHEAEVLVRLAPDTLSLRLVHRAGLREACVWPAETSTISVYMAAFPTGSPPFKR
jgi:hypothetical protein